MRVAGFGFRREATTQALHAALRAAGGGEISALATVAEKAHAPAMKALARELGLRVIALPAGMLAGVETMTNSSRIQGLLGTGSLAEAAALRAAGPGAKLLGPRAMSPDGLATAAIAERSAE